MRRNKALEYGMMVDWKELEIKLDEAGFFESTLGEKPNTFTHG